MWLLYSNARSPNDKFLFLMFGRAKPSVVASKFLGVVPQVVDVLLVWLVALVDPFLLLRH